MTLEKTSNGQAYSLRTHRPGDMGYITYRHGVLYTKDHGYNERIEMMVARICADFIDNLDPSAERCWIAERDGEFLGCVMLVKEPGAPQTSRLRVLLVEPTARGMGIGSRLVDECVRFARDAGYKRVVLLTQAELLPARRLYRNAGFELVREESDKGVGSKFAPEEWALVL